MRFPRNGSPPANALWAVAGGVAGIALTWSLVPPAEIPRPPLTRVAPTRADLREIAGEAEPASFHWNKPVPERLVDALERGAYFRNAGAEAARQGLTAALDQAYGIGNRQDQLDFYRGLYGVWSEVDPTSALDHAQGSLPAGQLQSDAIGIAINKWAGENPREAWLWAEQNLTGPLKERALTDLMIGWSRRAPEQAAAWLEASGLTSQPLYNAIGATWAETHPAAAAEWAASLPDGKAKASAEVAVAGAWGAQDPQAAAEYYEPLLAEGGNLNLSIALTDIWATTDPAATAAWIRELPDGPSKDQAAATLATVWAASDVLAAVSWSDNISSARTRREVIAHIGTTWGAIEPAAALEWLGSLPADEASEGIAGALYSWAGTDPAGMRDWLDSGTSGALGDQARRSLGDVLSETSLPDVMDLALGMDSAAARDETLSRYFAEWRKQDDEGAQDWLQTNWNSLPESSRSHLSAVQSKTLMPR